mmetsp:Transcript_1913/g.4250  ORF Transcript_1913/g.4250 Transcript_1913/m.4250 type:complete len:202 (-) Transcript_1913:522-1127(-)
MSPPLLSTHMTVTPQPTPPPRHGMANRSHPFPSSPASNARRRLGAQASASAATPGRTLPSMSSSEAPPPVEMWDMSPALPLFSVAATESPPPMMVTAPFSLVRSARMSTIPNVPLEKASNSNTPIGPFMMTVRQSSRNSFCSAVVAGPLSSPIHPSGMASAATTWVLASAAKASATTMSEGRRICFPSSSALAMTSLAVST